MNVNIDIKTVGVRYGTVGWLKNKLETGEIWLEESNDYFVPVWAEHGGLSIPTHGLVVRDNKHSALIAYRNTKGVYKCSVSHALGDGYYCHWNINLTEAAEEALRSICSKWIEKVEHELEAEDNEIEEEKEINS